MKRLLILSGAGFCLWFFYSLAKPMDTRTALGSTTKTILLNIYKQCVVQNFEGVKDPILALPASTNEYKFQLSDGNCNGDKNNLIKAVSNDLSKYPTFSINMKTGETICSHNGPREELYGCNARRNGKW